MAENREIIGEKSIDQVRRISLYSFIVFLSISALMAVISVVWGKFGDFEFKILITTFVIAMASICSLCCSAFSFRKGRIIPGAGGIGIACLSAAMLIIGVWAEIHSKDYWQATVVLSVYAVACAHCLALLAVRLRPTQQWFQVITGVCIFFLASMISFLVLGNIDDKGAIKLTAVFAIVVALQTLVIPILSKISGPDGAEARRKLMLTKNIDGTWSDSKGRLYEVNEMLTDGNLSVR